jgi:hypothetical protein
MFDEGVLGGYVRNDPYNLTCTVNQREEVLDLGIFQPSLSLGEVPRGRLEDAAACCFL